MTYLICTRYICLYLLKNINECYETYLPLAGVRKPVGVRGRELPLGVATPSLLAVAAALAVDARVFVTLRIGMREGVVTSSRGLNYFMILSSS